MNFKIWTAFLILACSLIGQSNSLCERDEDAIQEELANMRFPPRSQQELVHYLKLTRYIRSKVVEQTMLQVDRAMYVDMRYHPVFPNYAPNLVRIGYGAVMSAPTMHALALELVRKHLKRGRRALDVGSGSGYLTACMGLMLPPNGRAVGIDHIPQFVERAYNVVKDNNPELISSGKVQFFVEDAYDGFPAGGPFDVVHVGASAQEVPKQLLDQMNIGGRLVMPIGPKEEHTCFYVVDKHMDGYKWYRHGMGIYFDKLYDDPKTQIAVDDLDR